MKSKKVILLVMIVLMINLIGCSSVPEKEIVNLPQKSTTNKYDLIVLGGEPEGIAAAVSAARNGLSVLLIEDDEALGGLMTLGKLNFLDMNHAKDGTLLTQGIFEEFYDKVGGNAFDIEKAKSVFNEMISHEKSIVVKLNTSLVEPIKQENKLVGIKVKENEDINEYFAKRFIDATTDADLAASSGVPYTFAGEDIGEKDRMMGVTLVFELEDVSWSKVFSYLNYSRVMGKIYKDERQHVGAKLNSAWGYTEEGYSYEPRDPLMRLRGFNIAKQENGNVLINALVIFGVDVLDEKSKENGIERAKEELKYILPYVQENFVGFKKAKLVGTAEELYVRESRHIIGEYVLNIDDVLENRDKEDRITLGSYPVDVQPTVNQRWGTVVGNPEQYSIPFRSLVPLNVENLLVVGRSASYSSLAAGSARVIPVGMCEGQAAGVASAYSIKHDLSFRKMTKSQNAITEIQNKLKEQGAYLEPFSIENPLTKHWAYEGVKTLRSLGLLDGGYLNEYNLEGSVDKWFIENLLNNMMKKVELKEHGTIEIPLEPTTKDIIEAVYFALTKEKGSNFEEMKNILKEKDIITDDISSYFAEESKKPQRAEVIVLVSNFYKLKSK
ncbi:FAD dependent oxidoreductase [Desulfonispora thiosulfatigenes DSM 11270]|uniref:FAD dependent oxidoreductase n=1 Tax=Desulfonispora thiosulfatigenes DSM 11270 TaxID=656914 RepID=A0A1W1VHC8_DESTI|nr:FAD-dependent oxidoreductase [Desulfonispora thiosulfatigenes]SMB92785.1 FAD dependent oxidoreductase [Desulfonispora thiosulfatigenes DSM 11270]